MKCRRLSASPNYIIFIFDTRGKITTSYSALKKLNWKKSRFLSRVLSTSLNILTPRISKTEREKQFIIGWVLFYELTWNESNFVLGVKISSDKNQMCDFCYPKRTDIHERFDDRWKNFGGFWGKIFVRCGN